MQAYDEKLISWFRYLYWSDQCYIRFENLLEKYEIAEDIPLNQYICLSSQWYASLYVVIEGWQTLNLQDAFIDRIINEHQNLIDLLRRYRNAIYHFQPRLLDNRIVEFGKSKDNIHVWTFLIHEQFVGLSRFTAVLFWNFLLILYIPIII